LTTHTDDAEFAALRQASALLGRDPLRTQAAGGNTSLKRDGVLWVKASGTWLAEAEEREIFLPVSLPPLLDAIHANDERAAKATDFVVADANPQGLRPSCCTSIASRRSPRWPAPMRATPSPPGWTGSTASSGPMFPM
jgi:rhamnose utilization protein RhaD (predicted bifunctional aldolase and dehydrogenase)